MTTYRCTRCDEKKERDEFPGIKKRNSWCKDCVKTQRLEKKSKVLTIDKPAVQREGEFDITKSDCVCGKPVMYQTYSEIICDTCGRAYKSPVRLGRRATEKEIADARAR